MKLLATDVAAMAHGTLVSGPGDAVVDSVSIDSRRLETGDLFIAIEGPRFDGHDFIAGAVAAGARGVVVRKTVPLAADVFQVSVPDTTRALQDLAAGVRDRSAVRVVAVTGSMGKTTTKDAAAAAIGASRSVLKTEGNLNNHFGLPLTLLRLEGEDVAVLEMGMSAPGEIARLAEIARPDVGVVTNVAGVHLEFFESVAEIAEAKGELYRALGPNAVAVVNADDPLVLEQARSFQGAKIRYGFGDEADLRARDVETSAAGVRFTVEENDDAVRVDAGLHGRHNVYNLLAAIAAARALGVPLDTAAGGLRALVPGRHRGERLELGSSVVAIDETYNANPRAMELSIDALAEMSARRRVAVLGDMLELGPTAVERHEEIGRYLVSRHVDLVIGVGELGRHIALGAMAAGLDPTRALVCSDAAAAAAVLVERVEPGDAVLFKASRVLELERAIAALGRALGGEES